VGDSWIASNHVRVAEYFWKDRKRMTLAQLQGGEVMMLEPYLLEALPMLEQAGLGTRAFQNFVSHLLTPAPRWAPLLEWIQAQNRTVVNWLDGLPPEFVEGYAQKVHDLVAVLVKVRPTIYTSVRWIKTNGHVILEESIWPGEHIPLLRMVGEEIDINNEVWRSGIIQNAMDPMRLENYAITMMAENVALSPLPGYIYDPRQITGYEHIWRTANRVPHAGLPYNASVTGPGGAPLGPPTRSAFEPPIQGISVLLQMFQQYTQQAIGIYQGNVGAPSRERSGRAIAAKDEQTDTGTAHYSAHAADTMRYEGELYIGVIPKVMNPAKIQRILGDDGSPQMMRMAGSPEEKQAMMDDPMLMEGMAGVYDMSSGQYDVLVDIGPSYATKRQEAADQMLQMMERLPEIMGPIASQVVEKMDWEGAKELADLIKRLPGQILPEGNVNKDQQLAIMRQQLTQAGQHLQALDALAQQQQQQLARFADDNKTLKEAHDLEALKVQDMQRDSTLAEREAAVKAQIEFGKLELDRERVALEREKLGLERHRIEVEAAYKRETARQEPEPGGLP
jgi:anti-sigma28 factor (negative regulator of flagellin synthesis)